MRNLPYLLPSFVLSLVLAATAVAGGGVLEINQTCAVQTGCFAGDTAGLPVTITVSGAYRLTSDLVLPDAQTGGIEIQAPGVDRDLAGFSIIGPVLCTHSGDPARTSCSATGAGWGVIASEPNNGARIHDGVVRGAGSWGVGIASLGVVENVRAFDNGAGGIFGSQGTRIESCNATRNGGHGISGVDDVQVIDCIADFNRDSGVSLQNDAEVRGVHARSNFATGITAGSQALVSGSSAKENGGDGVYTSSSSIIERSIARLNGGGGLVANNGSVVIACASNQNGGDGIAGFTINVQQSSSRLNGGAGINVTGGYGGNFVTNNATDAVTENGVNLGGNFCSGTGTTSSTCP